MKEDFIELGIAFIFLSIIGCFLLYLTIGGN